MVFENSFSVCFVFQILSFTIYIHSRYHEPLPLRVASLSGQNHINGEELKM